MLDIIAKCCTTPVYIIVVLALMCVVTYMLVTGLCLLLIKLDNRK